MHRFFIDQKIDIGDLIYLKDDDYNHLKNSLRIRINENIEISDGKNNVFECSVKEFCRDYCIISINNRMETDNEPICDITLYAAVLKGDRFESLIQKCIETGVNLIIPVITSNTIVDLDEKKKNKKADRWNKVARLACMQSKRGKLIVVNEPVMLNEAICVTKINHDSDYISLVCYEAEKENSIKKCLMQAVKMGIKKINIFIGPEGGFKKFEIENMNKAGILSAHLGKRILRADTAAVQAVFYTAAFYEL